MTRREIICCSNTAKLLRESGLTCNQVLKNLDADKGLAEICKRKSETVRWFCKNVLLFNNFGKKILI